MPDQRPPCRFERDRQLSSESYYAIGGRSRWLLRPETAGELADALHWCTGLALPVIVMGEGSNMLFSDEDFPGAVISLALMNRMFWISDSELFCEAGVLNTAVAEELQRAEKSGGEWLYRLPGLIGSTARMNGRCYGCEISEVTEGVVTAAVDGGALLWREAGEIFRGYKHTTLMDRAEIVAAVVLRFEHRKPQREIRELMEHYGADREGKHQFDYPSCGSTFKNNYSAGRPSGRIFEELGFLGKQVGGARVSDYHANFIFNTGNATAGDVLALAATMKEDALLKEGVSLELEVQCAGLFDSALLERCGVKGRPLKDNPEKSWAGLLWHPSSKDEDPEKVYPISLLQGRAIDYFCRDSSFPGGLLVRVEQLISLEDARLTPDAPFIRWMTRDEAGRSFPLVPKAPGGCFVDELWNYSVSEFFIGSGDKREGSYLEFEITPECHWVALRFEGARARSARSDRPAAEEWSGRLKLEGGGREFGMEFTYALIEPFIRNGMVALQCCASLGGGSYGLFPWWGDSDEDRPDFHQPRRFYRVRLR